MKKCIDLRRLNWTSPGFFGNAVWNGATVLKTPSYWSLTWEGWIGQVLVFLVTPYGTALLCSRRCRIGVWWTALRFFDSENLPTPYGTALVWSERRCFAVSSAQRPCKWGIQAYTCRLVRRWISSKRRSFNGVSGYTGRMKRRFGFENGVILRNLSSSKVAFDRWKSITRRIKRRVSVTTAFHTALRVLDRVVGNG